MNIDITDFGRILVAMSNALRERCEYNTSPVTAMQIALAAGGEKCAEIAREQLATEEATETGWIDHPHGAKMPVSFDTAVEAQLKNGSLICNLAKYFIWGDGSIIAYRVIDEAEQSS